MIIPVSIQHIDANTGIGVIPIPIHGIGGTLRTRAILVFQNIMRARASAMLLSARARACPAPLLHPSY